MRSQKRNWTSSKSVSHEHTETECLSGKIKTIKIRFEKRTIERGF